jgi:hypothetical protein
VKVQAMKSDANIRTEGADEDLQARTRPRGRMATLMGTYGTVLVVLLGLAIRLFFFNGYQGHEDRSYVTFATILAEQGRVAIEEESQWIGRIGFWLPIAASVKLLGLSNAAIALYPLICSLGGIWLAIQIGTLVFNRGTGLIAGILLATMPLDVILSTYAYVDLPAAVFVSLTLYLFLWAEQEEQNSRSRWGYLGAGLAAGVAYLHRENVVFLVAPLAVYLLYYRRFRWNYGWILAGGLLVMALESGFWTYHANDPFYRVNSIVKGESGGQERAEKRGLGNSDESPWTSWIPRPGRLRRGTPSTHLIEPALMFSTEQEFGLIYLIGWPIALVSLWRRDRGFVLAMWITVLTLVLAYFPIMYPFTMVRNARYYAMLSIPMMVLIAAWLKSVRPALAWLVGGLLVLSSLACVFIDSSREALNPVRSTIAFVQEHNGQPVWVSPEYRIAMKVLAGDQGLNELQTHMLTTNTTSMNYKHYRMLFPDAQVANSIEDIREGYVVIAFDEKKAGIREHLEQRGERVKQELPTRTGLMGYVVKLARAVGVPRQFVSRLLSGEGETVEIWRISSS